jgi:APA family basic amino acid/polyamine antiporter
VHADYRTPVAAIALQGLVAAAVLLVLRTFPSALDFTTFAILLATIADTAALYALRVRRPGQPRPYRAWGYPVVPGLYLAANAAIAAGLAAGRPREALVGAVVLLAALPCYALLRRRATGA